MLCSPITTKEIGPAGRIVFSRHELEHAFDEVGFNRDWRKRGGHRRALKYVFHREKEEKW